MIKVSNLKKAFSGIRALDGISFEVAKGEVLGFLGPNAAGKTTTMRILTTYIAQDDGEVEIAGYNVKKEPLEVKRRLGYLPENAPLYCEMEVSDFLSFVAEVRGVSKNKTKEAMETCGLSNVGRRPIGELSRGFRQRVGLASVLLHDPQILILDEPTAGLDPIQITEIRSLIKEIGKEKTIILSTHILPEAQSTCNRVIIINKGKIVGCGTPEKLSSMIKTRNFYITLKGSEIFQKIEKLPGAEKIEKLSSSEGEERYKISTSADLAEELFHFAVGSGLVMKELKSEEASLEDVFLSLTREETGENTEYRIQNPEYRIQNTELRIF
ncbi:MAG: ATP-binding cassette domain-containing protein [bacterium]